MLRAATGYSLAEDSMKAGREAAGAVKDALGAKITMAFVYFSNTHNPQALSEGLKEILPGVPVIGCTAYGGVILPEGFIGGRRFAAVMGLSDETMCVSVGAAQFNAEKEYPEALQFDLGTFKVDDDPVATARAAAELALAKSGQFRPPDFFFMTSYPSIEEYYIRGIASVIGRAPFAGCTAADSSLGTNWIMISDDGPVYDGLATAFFYCQRPPVTLWSSPYRETTDRYLVTRMVGYRRIMELGGKPPLNLLAKKYKCHVNFLMAGDLSLASPLRPLGVKNRLGDFIAICHPQYGNTDGSIFIGSPLSEGLGVTLMECEPEDIIESCGRELTNLRQKTGGQAGAYHLCLNHTWKLATEDRFEELVYNLIEAAEGVPFICPLTNGEHGFRGDWANSCGGPMISYVAFIR